MSIMKLLVSFQSQIPALEMFLTLHIKKITKSSKSYRFKKKKVKHLKHILPKCSYPSLSSGSTSEDPIKHGWKERGKLCTYDIQIRS